jgi:hypothetical protein
MTTNNITLLVRELVKEITGKDVVQEITTYHDPDYGLVVRLTVNLDAREALELWLKLVKQIPYTKHNIVIGVKWLGENNVTKEELTDYIVKIMIESGLKPKALEPLDIVKELREERNRR